jgi:hypothetical protein
VSLALVVGALLAVATLAYVLYPVVAPRAQSDGAIEGPAQGGSPERPSRRVISDDDIEAAVSAYRDAHAAASEAARSARGSVATCPVCGPRPERDASYCSNCGRPLTAAAAR